MGGVCKNHSEDNWALKDLSREDLQSLFLKVLKTWLEIAQENVVWIQWWPCFEQRLDWATWVPFKSELFSDSLCKGCQKKKRKLRSPVSSCKTIFLRSRKSFLKGAENFVLCSTFFCGTVVNYSFMSCGT